MDGWQGLADYYLQEPDFWIGVLVALGVAIPMAWFFGWLGRQWNQTIQFFQPTKLPAKLPMEKGPSPFQQSMSCFLAGLSVLLGLTLIAVCLYLAWDIIVGW